MKLTNKAIEQTAYDVMRTHTHTITRLTHKPTRMDLINMIEEIATTLVNIDISETYGHATVDEDGNNYGCLAGPTAYNVRLGRAHRARLLRS